MLDRRQLVQRSALLALAPTVPAFLRSALGATNGPEDRILVVVQLSGGNDGLNTVVPFRDDGYLRNRNELRLRSESLIEIDDQTAFHPSLRSLADLLSDGRLAIVQGAGYAQPNRSHDVSMATWQTASTDVGDHTGYGWLGRALDAIPPLRPNAPASLLVASAPTPQALKGRKCAAANVDSLEDIAINHIRPDWEEDLPAAGPSLAQFMHRSTLDAYLAAEQIEQTAAKSRSNAASALTKLGSPIAHRLKIISDLVQAEFGPRVYYAMQAGYDTHYDQLQPHAQLLADLSTSLKAFLDELESAGQADRVLVLCFSEFGRQVRENASGGTDHGTAGPVFLAGRSVAAGLHGQAPDLNVMDQNAPRHTVDFRRVYAEILQEWFGTESKRILSDEFSSMNLIRARS